MRNRESTLKKTVAIAVVAFVMAALLGLAGCAGGGAGGDVSNENKANAKTVIKAASNVFATTESLNLTEKDSPADYSQRLDAAVPHLFAPVPANVCTLS